MKVMAKSTDSEEEVNTPKQQSFISKWFGLSGDETDQGTVMTGESEYTSDYESGSSYDDDSTADVAFDRQLRSRHTKACKYMRVSFDGEGHLLDASIPFRWSRWSRFVLTFVLCSFFARFIATLS